MIPLADRSLRGRPSVANAMPVRRPPQIANVPTRGRQAIASKMLVREPHGGWSLWKPVREVGTREAQIGRTVIDEERHRFINAR